MNERQRALDLLRRIERESLYASLILHAESGFVRTLVLGVLRWRSRLDFAIRSLASRDIEPEILDILRLGAFQLLFTDVAPYAAVSETVSLVPKRARGFVNGVLRQMTRTPPPEPADLATRTAHPQWLIGRWTARFGEQRAAAIARANQELSMPDVLALSASPVGGSPSTLVEGMYRLRGSTAELDRAAFWPMDEGSGVIASMAAACGGEVLDLAAAPGSKSVYLLWRGVKTISNDLSITRLRPLMGRGTPIVVSDGRRPAFSRRFPTVLLDAPCSATGTIRKNPEIKWRLAESDLASFAALQRELLSSALSLTAGTCVYSTCSIEVEENERVVDAVMTPEFELGDARDYVPEAVRPWVANGVLHLTPESGADGFTAFVVRRR